MADRYKRKKMKTTSSDGVGDGPGRRTNRRGCRTDRSVCLVRLPNSGGARGHPDEGAAFPDGGAETPRAAAAPPGGYGAETSGFIAFGQLRIASPATICRICNVSRNEIHSQHWGHILASVKAQDILEPEYCLLLCTYVIYYMHINFSFMENRQCSGSHQIINEEGRYVTSHFGNWAS